MLNIRFLTDSTLGSSEPLTNSQKITEVLYINYDNIIERYNQLFLKYITACKTCKAKDFCSVCVVSDINGYEVCNRAKPRNIEEIISFFEANPEEIREIIKNISII